MTDVTATHDANTAEPIVAKPPDRDDGGNPWSDWDDVGGEG
jgi:hypothetical protein